MLLKMLKYAPSKKLVLRWRKYFMKIKIEENKNISKKEQGKMSIAAYLGLKLILRMK